MPMAQGKRLGSRHMRAGKIQTYEMARCNLIMYLCFNNSLIGFLMHPEDKQKINARLDNLIKIPVDIRLFFGPCPKNTHNLDSLHFIVSFKTLLNL